MSLVDIQVVKGVFDAEQKAKMIERVTDTMVTLQGEAMRGLTWVRVHEIEDGEWGIGGKLLHGSDVRLLVEGGL